MCSSGRNLLLLHHLPQVDRAARRHRVKTSEDCGSQAADTPASDVDVLVPTVSGTARDTGGVNCTQDVDTAMIEEVVCTEQSERVLTETVSTQTDSVSAVSSSTCSHTTPFLSYDTLKNDQQLLHYYTGLENAAMTLDGRNHWRLTELCRRDLRDARIISVGRIAASLLPLLLQWLHDEPSENVVLLFSKRADSAAEC